MFLPLPHLCCMLRLHSLTEPLAWLWTNLAKNFHWPDALNDLLLRKRWLGFSDLFRSVRFKLSLQSKNNEMNQHHKRQIRCSIIWAVVWPKSKTLRSDLWLPELWENICHQWPHEKCKYWEEFEQMEWIYCVSVWGVGEWDTSARL